MTSPHPAAARMRVAFLSDFNLDLASLLGVGEADLVRVESVRALAEATAAWPRPVRARSRPASRPRPFQATP